jgi:hypothetical protein
MTLPVIMVSGTMSAAELTRQPWLEIEALLVKPYAAEELLATGEKCPARQRQYPRAVRSALKLAGPAVSRSIAALMIPIHAPPSS